jgi:hypothetical protein
VTEKIAKGVRIVGEQRDVLVSELAERYAAGESIRSIAQDIGRSYGFVHGVLRQSQTPLRGRGGAIRNNEQTLLAETAVKAEASAD